MKENQEHKKKRFPLHRASYYYWPLFLQARRYESTISGARFVSKLHSPGAVNSRYIAVMAQSVQS
jgi:hypothetical protein